MRFAVRARPVVAFVVASMLSACSSDAPTAAGPAPLNVGALLLVLELAVPIMARAQMTDPTQLLLPPTQDLSLCAYSAATQSFNCPPSAVLGGGLTVTRAITIYDAAGHTLSSADAATAASVRFVTTVSGTITLGSFTFLRADDALLSGLLDGHLTLNETAIGRTASVPGAGGGTSFTTDDTTHIVNLALPAVVTTTTFPLSGTITDDETSALGGFGTPRHSVMTFDGSSTMALTVTTNGVVANCKINLANLSPQLCQ